VTPASLKRPLLRGPVATARQYVLRAKSLLGNARKLGFLKAWRHDQGQVVLDRPNPLQGREPN